MDDMPSRVAKVLSSERDLPDRYKEQQRRELKQRYPNAPLKWNGHRWEVKSKKYLDRKHQIEEKYDLVPLYEISLRTGAITGFLLKVKQYGSAVDKGVMKLRALSSNLQNATDEKERDKIHSEIVKADADVLLALRKMSIYGSLVSASGGLGADRTYKLLKKMEKRGKR